MVTVSTSISDQGSTRFNKYSSSPDSFVSHSCISLKGIPCFIGLNKHKDRACQYHHEQRVSFSDHWVLEQVWHGRTIISKEAEDLWSTLQEVLVGILISIHCHRLGRRPSCVRFDILHLAVKKLINHSIYVGFPKMAQDQVSAATAEIISVKITNPTPTSFHVVQDGFSNSDSSFHPFLDAFNVSTSIAGSAAYGMVTLPGLTSDAHVPVHVEQDVQILDIQAFADYNIKVLTSQTFEQRLNGTTTLTLGALPATSVSYDKTVTMNGKLYSSENWY